MNRAKQIALNLEKVLREVLPAKLIAVSKYSEPVEVSYAYHAGQRDFGENRVQDLSLKSLYFESHELLEVNWHFIGHLQTNKVKDLLKVEKLSAIHSVDSLKLTEELVKRQMECRSNSVAIFMQINTSKEDEKAGFIDLNELRQSIELIIKNEKIGPFKFVGLMTMATIRTSEVEKEAHRCFAELLELKNILELEYKRELQLSMGMSQDKNIALLYHTNFVRIGSDIFK